MIRRYTFLLAMLLVILAAKAQKSADVQAYIDNYKALAMEEMQRTGVPAAIKLAQGIHETEAGKSDLVSRSNNHFGIKCKSNWTGDKVYHDDDARGECFRSYASALDSYRDHSNFLKNSQRYAFLFSLDPTDYKGWAYGLKKAGYATNIKYSQLLIRLIETYNLQQYSLIALGKLQPSDEVLAGGGNTGSKENSIAKGPYESEAPAINPLPAVNYPEGVFEINGARVTYVKAGTSLLAVASQHGLTLGRLLEFNDMTQGEGDILAMDQLIFLQRKRKIAKNLFHIVQAGETLYDICQAEGIRYESILELNRLEEGMEPAIGERLYLQEKASVRPMLAGTGGASQVVAVVNTGESQAVVQKTVVQNEPEKTSNNTAVRHVVQSKETLYGISRKYGVSVEKIKEWNKLNANALKMGQELIIYTN
ncbi:LysM peptidoglycan-binding domain-containing protein [Flavihumibacter rivuli]|uniref:glucosaminidase domain-containing protein n=1 Tax=Flavihumibacter rivuli TaxID=2838156 RepID=UPI001BDF3104|nr:glucosaminidase domain-containing protein [Flavihumibacter rivuli]ULQ58284.1 LysM peptidoglycan-binding domain-containing protein [Flavihumibacter rivuli]